jgi:hypothetical protein
MRKNASERPTPDSRKAWAMLLLMCGMLFVLAFCVRNGCQPPTRTRSAPQVWN